MLQPLVPLTEAQLRARSSLKWSRAATDSVPLDIAEADFAIAEPIREALTAAVSASDLGYPDFDSPHGGPARLAETFAERMWTRYSVTVDPGRVEICAQIMQALCCAIMAFTDPGDYVALHEPTYRPIVAAIEGLHRRPILLPLPGLRDEATEHVGDFCGGRRVALIVLCQPHNPTGRILEHQHLAHLLSLAQQHGAVIFADEIHQDLTYESPFRSIATMEAAATHVITFTSAAKSFNIAGLRCAVGHFGTAELHRRFASLPWHLRGGAGTLGITATIAAWSACDPWLEEFKRLLTANRAQVGEVFEHVPGCSYTRPDGTYFAWLGLGAPSAGRRTDSFFKTKSLMLQPGTVFGSGYSGHVRINFATSSQRLECALALLACALQPDNSRDSGDENQQRR